MIGVAGVFWNFEDLHDRDADNNLFLKVSRLFLEKSKFFDGIYLSVSLYVCQWVSFLRAVFGNEGKGSAETPSSAWESHYVKLQRYCYIS